MCEFCHKVRKQRLLPIHMRICREIVECPQCRQPVGRSGNGRHRPGCPNGMYSMQPAMTQAVYFPPQSPQYTRGSTPLNLSAGGMRLQGNEAQLQQMRTSGGGGMTPQQLAMQVPLGSSAQPRMCRYCQASFYGSGNDHLDVCPNVPKCSYCGFINPDQAHLQNCSVAALRQDAYPMSTPQPSHPGQKHLTPQRSTFPYSGPTKPCSICKNYLLINEIATQLGCNCIFHELCISRRSICPYHQLPV